MKLPLGLLLVASVSHAAGFALEHHSARATGMATAVTAVVDDPSAVFYNAAGLVQGDDTFSAQLGDTLIAPSLTFQREGGGTTSTELGVSPPPHLFARYRPTPRFVLGLGVFSPYGASNRWPDDWEGRFRSRSSQLSTYFLNPSFAIDLHQDRPRVRVGGGVSLVRGTVLLERAMDFVDTEGSVVLGGGAWGVGFNLGAQFEVIKDVWDVGASWRSGVPLRFEGNAHFSGVTPEFSNTLQDQKVSTDIRLPDMIHAGVALRPVKALRLALEGHYVSWSQFRSLDLEFENERLSTRSEKVWHDAVSVHLGAEYDVNAQVQARAGLAWDPSASPDWTLTPDLPDATRWRISVGGSYAFGRLRADAGYQLVLLSPAKSVAAGFEGTYSGVAHVGAVTLGYEM